MVFLGRLRTCSPLRSHEHCLLRKSGCSDRRSRSCLRRTPPVAFKVPLDTTIRLSVYNEDSIRTPSSMVNVAPATRLTSLARSIVPARLRSAMSCLHRIRRRQQSRHPVQMCCPKSRRSLQIHANRLGLMTGMQPPLQLVRYRPDQGEARCRLSLQPNRTGFSGLVFLGRLRTCSPLRSHEHCLLRKSGCSDRRSRSCLRRTPPWRSRCRWTRRSACRYTMRIQYARHPRWSTSRRRPG